MAVKHQNNQAIAQIFRQMAALLDEDGVAFKPAAYRRAAQVVEDMEKDVSVYKEKKELMTFAGIGEATAEKILEFVKTGKVEAFEKLLRARGGLSHELLMIEDLGPKRVRVLQRELGLKNREDLIKAAEEGKLKGLPGFSEVMEKKILANAGRATERSRRFLRSDIEPHAEKLKATILKQPEVARAEIAGSYRRHKKDVGDLDLLVVTKLPDKVAAAIEKLPFIRSVVAKGERKMSFDLTSGIRVDVRFVKASQWGSALLYFTGDKEHNITLRKRAIDRGWKLNEYGLFEGEKVIAGKTEEGIYKALGLPFVEPIKRMGVL